MKDFILIALWGISSFIIFNLLWKTLAKKYSKFKAIQNKFSNIKKKNLYSNMITFILIVLIVVIREMFSVGYFGYGILLGALLSIADFLFKKDEKEEDKNNKTNKNNNKDSNNNKNYPRSNKAANKRKK